MSNTVKLHRVLKASPEKVFKAFTMADALAKWLLPYGFTCTVHELNPIVGGKYRMSFTNFTSGNSHSFGGTYTEIKQNELLRYTDQFEDASLTGEILVTIRFKKVACGTELNITQENVPSAIPSEMCYLGWQESLIQLARLVEPEIAED